MTEPERQHRSVSQLKTFLRCSEAYRIEKQEKLEGVPAAWFIQGTSFHAAIEAYEYFGRDISEDELRIVYEDSWASEQEKYLKIEPEIDRWMTGSKKLGSVDVEQRRARGWQQVKDYLAWAVLQFSHFVDKLPTGDPAVEVPFAIDLEGVLVRGYIDQVLTGGRVRDLKTGTKLEENSFQLAVYAIAAGEIMDRPYNTGDWYMAKLRNTTPAVDLTRYSRTLLSDFFGRLDDGITNKVFIPNVGGGCWTCGVRRHCRVNGGM